MPYLERLVQQITEDRKMIDTLVPRTVFAELEAQRRALNAVLLFGPRR